MSEVRIKKLKLSPSPGRVFQKIYKKGNPQIIRELKSKIKAKLENFERPCVLFYRVKDDELIFLGRVSGDAVDDEIERAFIEDLKDKMKRVITEIAKRNATGKIKEIILKEMPTKDASLLLDCATEEFSVNSIAGSLKIEEK